MIFREWMLQCRDCGEIIEKWAWNNRLDEESCPACSGSVDVYIPELSKAPGIVPDDIPGGVEIRHLSNKPERFYSRTEIKRACNERGFNWADDSPRPYKVHWSGIKKDGTPA